MLWTVFSRVRLLLPVPLAVLLTGILVTGCSGDDDCTGRAYHASLDQDGAKSPIQALEVWLGSHEGFDQAPPDEGWTVKDQGDKDPAAVVITNVEGDGWWVSAVRTTSGGYVVNEATDAASGCEDELS
ncbi:hypothetical protein [Nocardioides sp. URHA0032]|uniref:hypothetical protein n=1 Tax=Nocardioides sp. URHA0032 TaxID=1380388 RepID=UPI00048C284A|nr:hypothetical protein [Nocardioides sp. URHA0032]